MSDGAWVWGVDTAIARVAFAFANLDTTEILAETLHPEVKDLTEGERLAVIARSTRNQARAWALMYPPACVWIETPLGSFPKPQLMMATGVIQAALFETLGVPVWSIGTGTWKKNALGYGNASKAQVAQWVTDHGWIAESQDECDAIAMSHAGRLMFTTRRFNTAA